MDNNGPVEIGAEVEIGGAEVEIGGRGEVAEEEEGMEEGEIRDREDEKEEEYREEEVITVGENEGFRRGWGLLGDNPSDPSPSGSDHDREDIIGARCGNNSFLLSQRSILYVVSSCVIIFLLYFQGKKSLKNHFCSTFPL